jgi:hypothetical protein
VVRHIAVEACDAQKISIPFMFGLWLIRRSECL